MKYTLDIEVDLPVGRVVELFDDPDHLSKWQPNLVSFEHMEGVAGQPGAKSRLMYKTGKREIELIETLTVRDLPREFSGAYEGPGFKNWLTHRFDEAGPEKTRWICETEFQLTGFARVIGWVLPGMFRKQSLKFMQLFKAFAEGEGKG